MSRPMTTAMSDEAAARHLRPLLLVEAQFDEGTHRYHSAIGDITWDSKTWTGAGRLLGVDKIEEPRAIAATGVVFSLSGLPADLVALTLTSNFQGRPISAWLGAFDASGAVIADPVRLFKGTMSRMPAKDDGVTGTIMVEAVSAAAVVRRAHVVTYTHEHQQARAPGDDGFKFGVRNQERVLRWGG